MKKYWTFSFVSAKSQLKSEVSNSYLNWLWWILDPLCFMFIYIFIFGIVFQAKEDHFPVFIFTGIAIWNFFNQMTTVSVKLVRNNKGIVSKVYIPKYVLLLTKVWVSGFKMLISFGIIAGMMLFYRITITWNVLFIVPILMVLVLLSFGIGTILMHLGVFLDDLSNLVSIGLKIMFYVTGVFYNVSSRIPAPYGELLEKFNPIAFLLEAARGALIYGRTPHLGWLAFWFAMSVLITYFGIQTIYKNENSYVKVL